MSFYSSKYPVPLTIDEYNSESACRELPEDTLLCSILSWIQASQIASQPIRSPTTPVLDPSVLATMKTTMQLTVEKMDEFSSANGNLRNQKAKALILPMKICSKMVILASSAPYNREQSLYFKNRFKTHHRQIDLDFAILLMRHAIRCTRYTDPLIVADYYEISLMLEWRFGLNKRQRGKDLDEAIALGRDGIGFARRWSTPVHEKVCGQHRRLGTVLLERSMRRFIQTKLALRDANDALAHFETTLRLYPNMRLLTLDARAQLGVALYMRYQLTGDMESLDDCITAQQYCTEILPSFSRTETDHQFYYSNLSESFGCRYNISKHQDDLRGYIANAFDAFRSAPPGHKARPIALMHLSMSVFTVYKTYGTRKCLDEASEHAKAALEAAVPDDPNIAHYHHYMSVILLELKDVASSSDEVAGIIQQAIDHSTNAVNTSYPEHSKRVEFLVQCGKCHKMKFLHNPSDVGEVIIGFTYLAKITHEGLTLSTCSKLLQGELQLLLMKYESNDRYLPKAISNLRVAAQSGLHPGSSLHAPIKDCFHAACSWATSARSRGKVALSLDGYRAALDLIALMVPMRWTGLQRLRATRDIDGLATDAASCAIQLGELETAIELLEQGRGVIWAQNLQLRVELQDVRRSNQTLADRLESTAKALEDSNNYSDFISEHIGPNTELAMQRHRRLAEQWEKLVDEVRTDCFPDFLRPKSFKYLRQAARSGAIVIVNISRFFQCDALFVTAGGSDSSTTNFRSIPLPDVSFSRVSEWSKWMMEALRKRSNTDSKAGDDTFNKKCLRVILELLLDNIVEPVMKEIKELELPIERLWLCPTGPLTLLPLHAAFEAYDANLIVSYTPTLAALVRAQSSPPSDDSGRVTLLAVGQSNVLGEPALVAAAKESSLFDDFSSQFAVTRLEGDDAQVPSVLAALPQCDWAHFICHGHQDQLEPFKSYFALRDGKLMLSSITLARLVRGQFAYVSACEGATGVEMFADESVHLASGLQFAGFRGVIAPLWKVRDRLTAEVARTFYKHLCAHADCAPSASYAAVALHKAKRELLESGRASALDFVPYIHFGI